MVAKSLAICLFLLACSSPSTSVVRCHRRPNHIVNSADLSTLQFAQVIFRHGARTPLDAYPNDPYKYPEHWSEGEGQLTKIGKQMGHDLGKYLRWRYDGFLSNSYSLHEVHAQSSDFDRTIMTTQTALAGLFPTFAGHPDEWSTLNWQPIPVHSLPLPLDNRIAFYYENCDRYKQMIYELGNSSMVKQINRDNARLYETLKRHTGLETVDLRQVGQLYDTFFIQSLFNLPLPSWAEGIFPDQMKALYLLPFQYISQTPEMRRFRGGPLLTELIENMELTSLLSEPTEYQDETLRNKAKSFKQANLYIYSGHDTTITTLLAAIGVFDFSHIPPYTSMVMMELHKDPEIEEPYVRLFYRNETNGKPPIEIEIPNCIEDCATCQVCTLKKFKSLMTHNLISGSEWSQECQQVYNSGSEEVVHAQRYRECRSLGNLNDIALTASAFPTILSASFGVGNELYELFLEPFANLYALVFPS